MQDSTTSAHPFDLLTPEYLLDAVEATGIPVDGRLLALNSFENRVYQIGVNDAQPLIAKFYRPGRWTPEQIREEHVFTLALAEQEIPAIAPLVLAGDTLHRAGDFWFALYPRQGGHPLPVDDMNALRAVGRQLGRLHSVGRQQPFRERPRLDSRLVSDAAWRIACEQFVPPDMLGDYRRLSEALLAIIRARLDDAGDLSVLRVHGDCHPGNVLWRDGTAFFVDFDDSRTGPAVQDLWLFLSGDHEEQRQQWRALLEGYQDFADFNPREARLVDTLRALRLLHYATWLASRWDDPAFPPAFPWFEGRHFWSGHLATLRDQLETLQADAAPLSGYR